uniref:Uncharacterized protein n=1 Tax=Anopheles atroparvus TaxID=41427 RepID=A0A182J5N2_ANOAO
MVAVEPVIEEFAEAAGDVAPAPVPPAITVAAAIPAALLVTLPAVVVIPGLLVALPPGEIPLTRPPAIDGRDGTRPPGLVLVEHFTFHLKQLRLFLQFSLHPERFLAFLLQTLRDRVNALLFLRQNLSQIFAPLALLDVLDDDLLAFREQQQHNLLLARFVLLLLVVEFLLQPGPFDLEPIRDVVSVSRRVLVLAPLVVQLLYHPFMAFLCVLEGLDHLRLCLALLHHQSGQGVHLFANAATLVVDQAHLVLGVGRLNRRLPAGDVPAGRKLIAKQGRMWIVQDNRLEVKISGNHAKHVRVGLTSFFDSLILCCETLDQFGPPVSEQYDHC